MMGNTAVTTAAANALATNTQIMDMLKPFGIQNGADIKALGAAVFDVMDAAKSLASNPPDLQAGLQSLAKAVGGLSPDLRARMVGAFADKVGLPAWAKDTLVAAAGLIGNEAVGKSLGEAFDALKRGDIAAFAAGLAHTGRTIAETSPEVARICASAPRCVISAAPCCRSCDARAARTRCSTRRATPSTRHRLRACCRA
jgi:hypothetical protein